MKEDIKNSITNVLRLHNLEITSHSSYIQRLGDDYWKHRNIEFNQAINDLIEKTNTMTQEQFKAQRWGYGMSCTHKGKVREIASVDFEEGLVGLSDGEEAIQWVRHENCELIN